jgi:Tol biopolymer transport system component
MKLFASVTRDGHVFFNGMTAIIDVWSVDARPDEAVVMSDSKEITFDLMQKFGPSITRDGTKLAYAAFGGVQAGRFELRLRNITTGQETTVPTQAMSFNLKPRLSPDGSVLAYRDFVSDKWRTFVIPVGGASGREICDSCVILDFFPDTDFALVKISPDILEKMNLRNGQKSPILAVEKGSISDASLSPDGAWISYLTGEPDGRAVIWISPINGPSVSGKQKILITEDHRYISPPEWSPNGCYIYFLSKKNDRCAIYAQKLDPRTKEPVEEASEAYFSPESRFHLNFPIGQGTIGVAKDKIIFHVSEMTGNIFLARPKSK